MKVVEKRRPEKRVRSRQRVPSTTRTEQTCEHAPKGRPHQPAFLNRITVAKSSTAKRKPHRTFKYASQFNVRECLNANRTDLSILSALRKSRPVTVWERSVRTSRWCVRGVGVGQTHRCLAVGYDSLWAIAACRRLTSPALESLLLIAAAGTHQPAPPAHRNPSLPAR